jgi:hypothetical protein
MIFHILAGTDDKDIKVGSKRALGMVNVANELEYLYNLRDKVKSALENWHKRIGQPFVKLSTDEIDYLIDTLGVKEEYVFNVSEPMNGNLIQLNPIEIEDWDNQGYYEAVDYSNSVRAKSLMILLDAIYKRIEKMDKGTLLGSGDPRSFSLAFKEKNDAMNFIPYAIIIVLGLYIIFKGN